MLLLLLRLSVLGDLVEVHGQGVVVAGVEDCGGCGGWLEGLRVAVDGGGVWGRGARGRGAGEAGVETAAVWGR